MLSAPFAQQSEQFLNLSTLTQPPITHLHAHKVVCQTRPVYSCTSAPAKQVSPTMDFRAFVAKAPHLTILCQRVLVYGGKLLLSNAAAKILKALFQK